MDHLEKLQLGDTVVPVLKKLLQSKNADDTYIDKILTAIDDELNKQVGQHKENISPLWEWLSETIHNWNKSGIHLAEAEFICKFIGLLSKHNESLQDLHNRNILNDLVNALKNDILKHTTLKIIFIKMLSTLLDHNANYAWIRTSQVWKLVVEIYFSNANLYIEREVMVFFRKLISTAASDNSINEDLLEHVFLPIKENFKSIGKDKKLNPNILLALKLLEIILKINIFSQNNNFHLNLEKICNIEAVLKNIFENSQQENILEATLVSQVLFSVLKFEDKNKLAAEDSHMVLVVFNKLLLQNQFVLIIKLAKYCQTFWNEMRNQMDCTGSIGGNFILMQLLPSLICINIPSTDTEYELYMKKLFSLKSTKSQTFFNSLGKAMKSDCSLKQQDLPTKSILSIATNIDSFSCEEGILILQAMIFITKSLISESGYDLETSAKKFKKLGSPGIQDKSLLSAVLNGVSHIVKKFKTNWTELEKLGLFKIINSLLKIFDLSSLVVVQTLQVVQVSILNSASLNAAENSIQTYFESLMPLLYERMSDPSWEVRDSSIEVVITIAELNESKNSTFEKILLEKDFHSILLDIVENDTESYVRASAIRALTVMAKTELLNPFLNDQDSCLKVAKLVENESEGIVRREAALLIKQIYLTLNEKYDELKNLFYKVMGHAALSDLHWEVKVNCLAFWEAVIKRMFEEEAKRRSSSNDICLNKEEVTRELHKTLNNLSKIGCLHVLLSILNEDCDMIVIKKSAEVLSDLLSFLKQYNMTVDASLDGEIQRKRKNSGATECEKSKIPSMRADNDVLEGSLPSNDKSLSSEKVIEDIVNDTDFNLLKNVSTQYDEYTSPCDKAVFLQEIEPEAFLKQMEGFDKDKFLENKQKWFTNVETDLTLTLNKINIEKTVNEINIMDCY